METKKREDIENFDWELFGAIIRSSRKKLGFKKADLFCEAIYRRSRISISPASYYRIEQGTQEPNAMQLFGICMALYGEPLPLKIIETCSSEGWKTIYHQSPYYRNAQMLLLKDNAQPALPSRYDLPSFWSYENYLDAVDKLRESGECSQTEEPSILEVALTLGEKEEVFSDNPF